VINRLSRVVGHIEAIKRMVENDTDCSQILIQLAAVKAAVNNAGNLVLKNHIAHCIVHAVNEGDEQTLKDLNNAIDRFIK
jgi:DNA-binding FrmR family transcriptional regulator